jgi:membrane-associated protease RseP (regulator of RpoE activity)
MDPAAADFFLYPQEVGLPASGLLGVMLESDGDQGGARIQGFAESSGAKDAGIKEGDRIVQIGDQPVSAYADVRIALIDGRPGEKLPVEVLRERKIGDEERLSFEVIPIKGSHQSCGIRTADAPSSQFIAETRADVVCWLRSCAIAKSRARNCARCSRTSSGM